MGLAHLVESPESFVQFLRDEFASVPADDTTPLTEPLRPDGALVRLNLKPFKAAGGDVECLAGCCLQTASMTFGTSADLRAAWAGFIDLCRDGRWSQFSMVDVDAFTALVEQHGYPAVHHSPRYVQAYAPAYRLLSCRFLPVVAPDS